MVLDRNDAGALAVTEAIKAEGGTSIAIECDISDPEDCVVAADRVKSSMGPCAVLINNAGIVAKTEIVDPEFADLWADVQRVNVDGTLHMTRAFLGQLTSTVGVIVNVSSASATLASKGGIIYSTTKGTIEQMTRALAVELGARGIRVNAIAPGVIETPANIGQSTGVDITHQYQARTPLEAIVTREELLGTFLYLASPLSSGVTGVTIAVDGGYTITGFAHRWPVTS